MWLRLYWVTVEMLTICMLVWSMIMGCGFDCCAMTGAIICTPACVMNIGCADCWCCCCWTTGAAIIGVWSICPACVATTYCIWPTTTFYFLTCTYTGNFVTTLCSWIVLWDMTQHIQTRKKIQMDMFLETICFLPTFLVNNCYLKNGLTNYM